MVQIIFSMNIQCVSLVASKRQIPQHTEHSDLNSRQHDSVCSKVVELEGPGRLGRQGGVVELQGPGQLGQQGRAVETHGGWPGRLDLQGGDFN